MEGHVDLTVTDDRIHLTITTETFDDLRYAVNSVLQQSIGFAPTTFTASGTLPLPEGLTEAELRRRFARWAVPGVTIERVKE